MTELILKHGANINHADKFKRTPLHYACIVDNKEAIAVLIKHGTT